MDCQATPHFDVVEANSSFFNRVHTIIICLYIQEQAQQMIPLCLLTVL